MISGKVYKISKSARPLGFYCCMHIRYSYIYLTVARLCIVEGKHDHDEEQSSEEVKATPPSARHLQVFIEDVSQLLGPLYYCVA